MKALVQRVSSASVRVAGETIGAIGCGLCVLVGIAAGDTVEDIGYLVNKLVNLRIFTDETGKFNLSVIDTGGELLLISQFTLLADTRKGRRPSFTGAAPPEEAEAMFEKFTRACRESGVKTETGRFQAMMLVEINNNGPVTIMLDSRER